MIKSYIRQMEREAEGIGKPRAPNVKSRRAKMSARAALVLRS